MISRSHHGRNVRVWVALLLLAWRPGYSQGAIHLVPEFYPTIQAGIDACAAGDTVSVAAGTYAGPGNRDLTFHGRDIILTSRAGALATTIDGEMVGRGFLFQDGESEQSLIEGFTVVHGYGWSGGGVSCTYGASPRFRECRFLSNRAQTGGGVYLGASSATFEACVVAGNWAYGVGGGGGVRAAVGDVIFDRCVITGNGGYRGGGFLVEGASVILRSSTVATNMSNNEGGGIFTLGGPILLDRTIIWGNCAADEGHEIYARSPVTLSCAAVDSSGFDTAEAIYEGPSVFDDPRFCAPASCGFATPEGDYSLRGDSPCLPEGNPCAVLIGALDVGCPAPPPEGACCLADDTCVVDQIEECEAQGGSYLGDGTECEPNPCIPTARESTTWGRIRAGYR